MKVKPITGPWQHGDDPVAELPISFVMLLRRAHWFTLDELVAAAEKAWGCPFSKRESDFFVEQKKNKALINAPPYLISILCSDRPYFDRDPNDYASTLGHELQRLAWAQHLAWVSLDSIQGGKDKEAQYRILANLAAGMLDANCTGVYVPSQNSFIPNSASLYNDLRMIGRGGS